MNTMYGTQSAAALAQSFGPGQVGGPSAGIGIPPQTAPQVYAQNPQCGLPAINTYVQPPCPDPRTALQINKRVFITVTAGILIIDFGNATVAGFGADDYGRVATAPTPGTFNVTTDSTTIGYVRDITIAFDPFATTDFGAGVGSDLAQLLRSFGQSFSALLAGQVTVENTPFPTVIPVASAIKNVGGINSFWTLEAAADIAFVSPVMEATHAHAPAPIEIYLPVSSSFRVLISVPNRAINAAGAPAAAYVGYVFVWTGVITILQENNTLLGAVAGAPMAAAAAPAGF